MKYTKLGIVVLSLLITTIIYFCTNYIFNKMSDIIIAENEQNKAKSLLFIIDR